MPNPPRFLLNGGWPGVIIGACLPKKKSPETSHHLVATLYSTIHKEDSPQPTKVGMKVLHRMDKTSSTSSRVILKHWFWDLAPFIPRQDLRQWQGLACSRRLGPPMVSMGVLILWHFDAWGPVYFIPPLENLQSARHHHQHRHYHHHHHHHHHDPHHGHHHHHFLQSSSIIHIVLFMFLKFSFAARMNHRKPVVKRARPKWGWRILDWFSKRTHGICMFLWHLGYWMFVIVCIYRSVRIPERLHVE